MCARPILPRSPAIRNTETRFCPFQHALAEPVKVLHPCVVEVVNRCDHLHRLTLHHGGGAASRYLQSIIGAPHDRHPLRTPLRCHYTSGMETRDRPITVMRERVDIDGLWQDLEPLGWTREDSKYWTWFAKASKPWPLISCPHNGCVYISQQIDEFPQDQFPLATGHEYREMADLSDPVWRPAVRAMERHIITTP
jgi:hypothetical protein